MDNTMEVELLNVIKYQTKDNRERTMLRFRSIDKDSFSDNSKFKGYSVIESYYDGYDVFDKIPKELFGVRVVINLKRLINPSNPLKQSLKVVKVNDIDLV